MSLTFYTNHDLKKDIDDEFKEILRENAAKRDENFKICPSIVISDKYAIGRANCTLER